MSPASKSIKKIRFLRNGMNGMKVREREATLTEGLALFDSIRKKMHIANRQNQVTVKRRRLGELKLEGSEYDSSKLFHKEHCFFYIIVLFFIVLMAVSIIVSIKSTDVPLTTQGILQTYYNDIFQINWRTKSFSYYVFDGPAFFEKIYRTNNATQKLASNLQSFKKYR